MASIKAMVLHGVSLNIKDLKFLYGTIYFPEYFA